MINIVYNDSRTKTRVAPWRHTHSLSRCSSSSLLRSASLFMSTFSQTFAAITPRIAGPLSCYRQMSIELEKGMTRAMYRHLGFVIRVVQSEWNSLRCPPLRVTIPPYTTTTQHDDSTLDLGLPNLAFTSSWLLTESLHRTILPRLSQFNLARLSISFFDDNTYTPGTR